MDELLLRQLVRQLKLINFWITTFGVIFLVALIIMGILLFKAITFLHDASNKLTSAQQSISQSLNVKQEVCNNKNISSFLSKNSDVCK